MKWLGEDIFDFITRFRNTVYYEGVPGGTVASAKYLGLTEDGKLVTAGTGVAQQPNTFVKMYMRDDGDKTVTYDHGTYIKMQPSTAMNIDWALSGSVPAGTGDTGDPYTLNFSLVPRTFVTDLSESGSITYDGTGNASLGVIGTLGVGKGGTGQSSFADNSVIIRTSGASSLSSLELTTAGGLLIGGSSGPQVATLTQGSNVTITNSNNNITIASANDNTFRTIKVDTTNDGTANETIGANEELKLVGGSNITLTESAGTVTITSTASGVGGAIDDLSDVDTSTTSPSVNEVLKWNGSEWVPAGVNESFEFSVSYNRLDTPDTGTASSLLQLMGSGQFQSSLVHSIAYNNGPSGSFSSVPTINNVGNTPGNSVTGGYPLNTTSNGTVATSSAINYPASLVHTSYARFIFRVTATHGGTTDNNGPDYYIYFRNKKYFGPQAADSLTSTQVIQLGSSDWMKSTSSNTSADVYTQAVVNVTCNNQYVYYCYPSRISGTPTFKINGFVTPFTSLTDGNGDFISVTNAHGFAETYKIWQSENKYGTTGAATLTLEVI